MSAMPVPKLSYRPFEPRSQDVAPGATVSDRTLGKAQAYRRLLTSTNNQNLIPCRSVPILPIGADLAALCRASCPSMQGMSTLDLPEVSPLDLHRILTSRPPRICSVSRRTPCAAYRPAVRDPNASRFRRAAWLPRRDCVARIEGACGRADRGHRC